MNAPPSQQRHRCHDQLRQHPVKLKVDQPVRRIRYQAQHDSDDDYNGVQAHFNNRQRLLFVLDELKQATLASPNCELEEHRAFVVVRCKLPVQKQE